ncbi:11609_t:CDS:2, partial [Racocetra persica]
CSSPKTNKDILSDKVKNKPDILSEKMTSETLLLETLNKEKKVKQKTQQERISKNFSWVLFFAGEEYNQELSQQEIPEKNIIDFAQVGQEKGE